MIAIVGNPRSGTSLTSLIHVKLLGEDRCIGSKFMGRDEATEPVHGPVKERVLTPIQEYARTKITEQIPKMLHPDVLNRQAIERKKRLEEMKDMNQEGFWECPFTVQGMKWSIGTAELWAKIRSMEKEPFCKLVNSGVSQTDPVHISKIVYVNRHPREVARSQEKLKGGMHDRVPEGDKIHSPDFFIRSSVQFANWYLNHGKNIPLLMIDHGDLLAHPVETVAKIANFHGVEPGDAHTVVRQDLYRSKKEEIPHPQFEDAIAIYEMMGRCDFAGVVAYIRNPDRMTHKVNARFQCFRRGKMTTLAECQNCINKDDVKANFLIQAEKDGIEWEKEPCALECGALDAKDAKSIADSIKDHSWVYESAKVGTAIEKLISITGLDKLVGKCKGCEGRRDRLDKLFKRKINWDSKGVKDVN